MGILLCVLPVIQSGLVVDNPSVSLRSPAPLTGSKTSDGDLPLCEERGTACGGEVNSQTPHNDNNNANDNLGSTSMTD